MLCEETKQSLSLYIDDCVSLPTRVEIEQHLERCPVCRAESVELRLLTRRLSLLPRATTPTDLARTITDALAIEAAARRQTPPATVIERITRFIEPRLMPYTVGSFASVLLFFMMFTALRPHFIALREASARSVIVIKPTPGYDLYQPVNAEDFAASRAPYAEESPTLNPGGALAALTRSYTHGQHRLDEDDDMIVVANVFSDGVASLADVVQPPRDRRMLADFESALRQDAAFVPAALDNRPATMRVVFAVQKVDVQDNF